MGTKYYRKSWSGKCTDWTGSGSSEKKKTPTDFKIISLRLFILLKLNETAMIGY